MGSGWDECRPPASYLVLYCLLSLPIFPVVDAWLSRIPGTDAECSPRQKMSVETRNKKLMDSARRVRRCQLSQETKNRWMVLATSEDVI